MVESIDKFAAENRRKIRNTAGRFVEVNAGAQRNLFFGVSQVAFLVESSVETRDTGDQVVVGNADESKGFGRGTFGDDRGEFTEEPEAVESETATENGLSTVALLVSGDLNTPVDVVGYGYGDDEADRLDDSLSDRADSLNAVVEVESNVIDVYGIIPNTVAVGDGFESSVDFGDGSILSRTTAQANISPTEDVRVSVTYTVEGFGRGASIFPDAGEAAIAACVAYPSLFGIVSDYSFSDTENIDESTTTLPDESFDTQANTTSESVSLSVEGRVEAGDPPEQFTPGTLREVSVVTGTDAVLWSTPTRNFPVDDETAFTVEMSMRFVNG